jgi:acyl-CoA thioesterase
MEDLPDHATIMEDIKQFFTQDRYAKLSGIELLSVSAGHAVAQMPIQPHHLNAVGCVQGGAIFTLADLAFAAASNAHGKVAVAINVSITYMKAATSGTLRAEAREVSANPKLGSYTVNITDEHNALIAVFQGLVYRKDQALPWAAKG